MQLFPTPPVSINLTHIPQFKTFKLSQAPYARSVFSRTCCTLRLLALILFSFTTHAAIGAAETRPNIILLIADDLGYAELGCQGNTDIPTPHIDALATQGVRFTDGYVTAAYCSASRAGLITGRYQTRFGYEFNPIGADNDDPRVGLPVNETTLADIMQKHGYATALIGKWHLGGTAAYHPLRRGFDEFFGFLHEGHYYVPSPYDNVTTMLRRRTLPDGAQGRWVRKDNSLVLTTHMGHHEPAYDANNPLLRDSQPVTEAAYLTDAFTREAIQFINRQSDRPFFLCLAYNAVHSPLQAKREDMERFPEIQDIHRRIFAGMLHNLDESVGAVTSTVDQLGLGENTLIFFISDNGGPTKELTSSNLPLRGGKGELYEGGIRVPFLARWNDHIPAGKIYAQPVISLDLFATALAAARLDVSPVEPMDGVNLLPHLVGETEDSPHEALFWRQGRRTALRVQDWKITRYAGKDATTDWELYNLREDVAEANNIAQEHPDKLRELTERWEIWNSFMIDPFWSRGR